MKSVSRRRFLQSVAATAAAPAILRAQYRGRRMPLAFSTLGCPKWEWKKILDQAATHGFAALELRGLLNEMDLPKSPQFMGERLKESVKDLNALGLKISDLGASARLGEPDPAKRQAQIDEAKRFIDLARSLKAPYVRVFGGKLEKGQTMKEAIDRIVAGFHAVHDHAKAAGVTLLIESHDEFVTSESLRAILDGVNQPTTQLLWDAHHTFVAGKEAPADTWKSLGRYVRHTHLKDSRPNGNDRRYVLTGDGDVPIKDTVKVLATNGYKGYYCFEWEKRWHPEIEDPEFAIPHYAKVMREYLTEAGLKA